MAANSNAAKASNKFATFFTDMKAEIKRITWASKEDVKKAFVTTVVFCLIYIVLVYFMDLGWDYVFKLIFKLK